MVEISDFIEKMKSFIHKEYPIFLLLSLKELSQKQSSNGSWYNDVAITSFIVRSLLKVQITGWNYKAAKDFIKIKQEKSDDYLFNLNTFNKKIFVDFGMNDDFGVNDVIVPLEIRKIFDNNNFQLSNDAKIEKMNDKTWIIRSNEIEYRIEESDEEINVFCHLFWGINPNIWVTSIVAPALFEMKMKKQLQNAHKKMLLSQSEEEYFEKPEFPWLTARFIISFIESGVDPSDAFIQKSMKWLECAQMEKGNWHSIDDPYNPDIEVTSMCIVALLKGGIATETPFIQKGLRYLTNKQLPDGSWNRDPHFSAHVLEALYYGHEEGSRLFQNGLNFIKESVQNLDKTWEPHSIGEIFYILTKIIKIQKNDSMTPEVTVIDIGRISKDFNEIKEFVKKYDKLLTFSDQERKKLKKCFLTGKKCISISSSPKEIFVGYTISSKYYDIESLKENIIERLKKIEITPFFADEHEENGHITCKICEKLQSVNFCLFEISDLNPNVMFELGLAYGFGKTVIIMRNINSSCLIPSDMGGIERIEYGNLHQLGSKIIKTIHNITKKELLLKKQRNPLQILEYN